MKRMLILLCALLFLCGCAPAEQAVPVLSQPAQVNAVPTSTPAPAPAPTPAAPSDAEMCAELLAIWKDTLTITVSPFLPANFFDEASPWSFFDALEEQRLWLPAMQTSAAEQLAASAVRATDAFAQAHPEMTITNEISITEPSWQLLYALLQGCEDAEAANALAAQAVGLHATAETTAAGAVTLQLTASPLPYREALRLGGIAEGAYLSRCFSYSYLYTIYDANAQELTYALPPAEGCLAEGIHWPLASHTRLRKTWLADRDGGKRRHTGTDIWADADTEIYSCTDGTVSYVGEGKGTGFAVIVTDAYGYEYHYYHMIRLSDFLHAGDAVSAGARIGNVGNTGNSDLDHLHLTIVAPDGKYVDPYPYLKAVEP